MVDDRLKVIFIAGLGGSGTTLLGRTLGELDGFRFGGELFMLSRLALLRDARCGCGAAVRECGFWVAVLQTACGGMDRIDVVAWRALRRDVRTRRLVHLLRPGGRRALARRWGELRDRMETLYRSIASVTNSRVIVDSSKSPLFAYIASGIPSVDLFVVHLVRHPTGSAYSRVRRAERRHGAGSGSRQTGRAAWAALEWLHWHALSEILLRSRPGRYLRMRYEDFVQAPVDCLETIVRLVGEPGPERWPVTPGRVEFTARHSGPGHELRFQTGWVTLRVDDEWRSRMAPLDRAIVAFLSWPLRSRYGYARALTPKAVASARGWPGHTR
jgi:hypothetical protein